MGLGSVDYAADVASKQPAGPTVQKAVQNWVATSGGFRGDVLQTVTQWVARQKVNGQIPTLEQIQQYAKDATRGAEHVDIVAAVVAIAVAGASKGFEGREALPKANTPDPKGELAQETKNAPGVTSPSDASNAKLHVTYTKTKPETGQVYSGRSSGTGTPEEIVAARDSSHHMTEQGYGPAVVDKASPNADAIRGREQQLIEANGGAQSTGGTSGNAINGISRANPNGDRYLEQAKKEFSP